MATGASARLSEAEVVWWLKRGLQSEGLAGKRVREILVDADGSYLRSSFKGRLEPTGTVWIGQWRPDLVCVYESDGAERLAGFEVKADTDHETGIIQANRYRTGVHEAYLCVPSANGHVPAWLSSTATSVGVGLVRASPRTLEIAIRPPGPLPDPRTLQTTRRYLLGEVSARAFGLNKPLHYAAAVFALAFSERPWEALTRDWGLGAAAVGLAARGAQALGLVSGDQVTVKGKAYADALRLMGFTLAGHRHLTKTRLAESAPNVAALLRTLLLQHPAVELIVEVLTREDRTLTAAELASRAMAVDEGLGRAVFGSPSAAGEAWEIKPTTRFQLKAALYDVGLIDTRLASGASRPQAPGGYDPAADEWRAGVGCLPSGVRRQER
jgi:hypothetical protein